MRFLVSNRQTSVSDQVNISNIISRWFCWCLTKTEFYKINVYTLTWNCLKSWYAKHSCLKSSPVLTIAGINLQFGKRPYGDIRRILWTFSFQGSFNAAAKINPKTMQCNTFNNLDFLPKLVNNWLILLFEDLIKNSTS